PSPRRARTGVALMFFTNGVLFSALLPRYPEFKALFGLGDSGFGVLVVAFAVGALLAAPLAGRVIRRFGALRASAVGSVALAGALAAAGGSRAVWLFALALAFAGALDAVVDAAQNVQGVLVEQWRGRSAMNSFHAAWSAGAATGGALGAAAAAADVDPGLQVLLNGAAWALVALLACRLAVVPAGVRTALRADERPELHERPSGALAGPRVRRRAARLLLPLVVLAICGTLVEDVANNWAVLFVRTRTGAPDAVAGLALSVALLAQFAGRLLGDPVTDRWGRAAVARAGGLVVAAGAALVVLSPAPAPAFAGFALAGLGCATLVPAAFAAAGRVPGLPEGTGIAVLGWLMRIGFLVTSPAVGALSELTDLRTALLVPVAAGLLAALVARALRPAAAGAAGVPASAR
ncbi:MFS transporter, partial [Kineococcus sp. T13]|uniref:MFS transporter n=1 Tax=Kineococcus vitellinus TaxID=2696565 RepID=UPI001412E315